MLSETENNQDGKINLFEYAARVMEIQPKKEINPFLADLIIETRRKAVKAGVEELFDKEGLVVDLKAKEIREVKFVDKEKFVKVLNKAFSRCFDLPAAGQKMFWVLLAEIGKNQGQDSVYIHYNQAVNGDFKLIPKTTFYAGIKALESAGFIKQKREKHFFWINPTLFFNGDRITLATTFIIKNAELDQGLPVVNRPGLGSIKPRTKATAKAGV